jgi:predicted acetyltransferase
MTNPADVAVEAAAPRDAVLLANLLELYIHDMSEVFPEVVLGAEGRFGYDKLPLYWSEPERRFPFVLRCGARCAGFVLVTRGSPASHDPEVFDVAELFVLRSHRRSGIARRAMFQVWDRLGGRWIVRVSEGNVSALPFWERTIVDYTSGAVAQVTRPGTPRAWRVFSFESRSRTPEPPG